jgi:hypothetical protein
MRGHLTDAEITEVLNGELRGETLAHLADCPICRAERDRLRATLTGLAEGAFEQSEREEHSWERQRRQIADRLISRPFRSPSWCWVWAPAAVGLAVVALVWFRWETPQQPLGPDANHAILTAVERSLQANVPAALQPVALLASEIERGEAETGREAGTSRGDQL